MSDLPPPNTPPGQGGNFAPSWRPRGRRSSVTLRQDAPEDLGSLMDPATQSLSDALRITYRFVQIAVIALAAFYILSGFRRVHEGERGIRLLFGKVIADDITPGFRFSWPEPFGELVKVRTGAEPLALEEEFFPQLTEDEKKNFKIQGAQALAGGGGAPLNPEADGFLLTGDGNIVHTRWAVTYHREEPKRVEENIDPDFESSIVLAACKRGIVRATATVSIDEILKNIADEGRDASWRPVESVAREVAQDTLDQMDSGIRIDILSMTARIPPRIVIPKFNEVQSSFSDAERNQDEARTERRNILLAAAGDAAELLLVDINNYGKAIELKDDAAAAVILDRINLVMQGGAVEINGETRPAGVYGRVSHLLSEADRDRRTYIANLQGEVQRFRAKLDTFRKNPIVLLNSEWADAYGAIMARPALESIILPPLSPDGRYVMNFNTNPELGKTIQQMLNKRKSEETEKARQQAAERARHETKIESTANPSGQ